MEINFSLQCFVNFILNYVSLKSICARILAMSKKEKVNYFMIIISLCGLAGAAVGLGTNSAGLFFTSASESLHVSRSAISFTATIVTIISAISALFLPKLLKPKTFKLIIYVGTILMIGGTCALAYCDKIWMLYVFSFVRGLGMGFLQFVMVSLVIDKWFKAKYSLVTSVVLMFSGIPGALLSSSITKVITNNGWQKGYLFMALLMLLFCLPSLLLPITLTPQEKGMTRYGEIEPQEETKEAMASNFSYVTPIFALMVVFVILSQALPAIVSHLPSYAQSIEFDAQTAAMTLSCSMVMNILSKVMIGSLTEKIGIHKTETIMLGINILAYALLLNASSTGILYTGSFLIGTIYGLTSTGTIVISKELFKEDHSKAYPVLNMCGFFTGAFSTTFLGYLYDLTSSYRLMFVIGIVFQLINIFVLMVIFKKAKKAQS